MQLAVVMTARVIARIAKVDGVRPLRVGSLIGHELVLHATAPGQVWLAALNPTEAVQIGLRPGPLRSSTPKPLTSLRPALLAELEAVRAGGYARASEERHLGVAAVAAPARWGREARPRSRSHS